MSEWLAHSPGKEPPVPPQAYFKHISEVSRRAKRNVKSLLSYFGGDSNFFRQAVQAAAIFHDLGKLDDENQKVLSCGGGRGLPINHVDAGTANLLGHDLVEAALVIYSHHIGLQSIPEERAKEELFLRDPNVVAQIDQNLPDYLRRHLESGSEGLKEYIAGESDWNGLTRRIALSCLVDADYGDTARNYGREFPSASPKPRWKERLKALDKYVNGLGNGNDSQNERTHLLREIYQSCRNADTMPSFYACDSPVGTGKTTAIMAHLLRVAIDKGLRHIVVVLPYTNIIRQSVDVYRKALVLPGESAGEVVAEHHHQTDFSDINVRQLATLWQAPIIVTTAVQFFETIAGNHPSKLRKLHELPGSAVFVDETHAAIPNHLWPQTWKWLNDLSERWQCHFVFASGSLPRFWELRDMIDFPEKLPDLVNHDLRSRAISYEMKRISPVRIPEVLDIHGLITLVLSKPGPRLVIMNTVQSAAVIADALAMKFYGEEYSIQLNESKVLHLSTSLTPNDRERILKAIDERLSLQLDDLRRDFTLVATSCVEAGVDFSFRSAFRQRASTASLIQIGGRVRRRNENFEPTLVDFKIEAPLINRHPAFTLSGQILEKLFDEDRFKNDSPADLVTEALRRELMSDTSEKHKRLQKMEAEMDYPEVAKLYKGNETVYI
ncbi:MAG: DEAD/DEAH box helicase family protein [Bacteroidetes bacterium]|nr:DEAD/DEAH box helicase family protein [Bacteroidota bacterium]